MLSSTVAPRIATALAFGTGSPVDGPSAANTTSRVAGLLAVAVPPGLAGITLAAYDHPAALPTGFRHAMLISGGLCVLGGLRSLVLVAGGKSPVTFDEPPDGLLDQNASRLSGRGALPTAETRAPAAGRRTLRSVPDNPSRPDAAVAPTTVSSGDGLVTAVVDAAGRLVELRLEPTAMRKDSAGLAELVRSTVDTALDAARTAAIARAEATAPRLPEQQELLGVLAGMQDAANSRLTEISTIVGELTRRQGGSA